ncbi:MAG: methyltransferase [Actinomycetota bacterium]
MSTYLFTHNWAGEEERLGGLSRFYDPGTRRHLDSIGVGAGWNCLEVGAGAGSIACWLASRVGPTGRVVATDLDTGLLEQLSVSNLEVRRHDIVTDDLPAGAFDLIHARLVLEHLAGRDQALGRMVAALAPGGWLVVEDLDWVSVTPVAGRGTGAFRRFVRMAPLVMRLAGYDPAYGRRLPVEMARLGLVEVRAEGAVPVLRGGDDRLDWAQLSIRRMGEVMSSLDCRGGPARRLAAEACRRFPGLWERSLDGVGRLLDDPSFFALGPVMMTAFGRRATC